MNPNDQPQDPEPRVNNPLEAMRDGEVNICEISRHPIGLIGVYSSFGFLLLLVGVVALIAPSVLTDYNRSTVYEIGAIVFIIALIFSIVFTAVAAYVYKGNRWILTSDSLTQVTQRSLFDKQSSQLSLGNLEDVTVQQDGLLSHMFNFGALRVETAGERSKFVLQYCPRPNEYAQKILTARESFEQGKWYNDQRPDNRSQAPTAAGDGVNVNTQQQ